MKIISSDYFKNIHDSINRPDYGAYPISIYENIVSADTSSVMTSIQNYLNTSGHCVLDLGSNNEHEIDFVTDLLSSYFGQPLTHKNRKQLPYMAVQSERDSAYYVTSNWTQPLHTDEGYTSLYPKIIALYCKEPAIQGGDSILVEFRPLLDLLITKYGDAVNLLFDKDCLEVAGQHSREKKPLLMRDETGQIGISYSPVLDEMTCSELVFEQYDFITNYVHNPHNQVRFSLKKNQILVLDNTRVLHSRTAFDNNSDRLLYRYWFAGCEL